MKIGDRIAQEKETTAMWGYFSFTAVTSLQPRTSYLDYCLGFFCFCFGYNWVITSGEVQREDLRGSQTDLSEPKTLA